LPAINKILFSKEISEKAKKAKAIPVSIAVPIGIMVTFTVLLGVYPELGLKLVNPAVNYMMTSLGGM